MGLHMSSVSEINAALISTLITAVLQTNYTLTSPQLFFGEVADIFVRFFWSDAWFTKVTSLKIIIRIKELMETLTLFLFKVF